MVSYHLTNIKFIDMSAVREEGKKLKVNYINTENILKKIVCNNDINIHITNIRCIKTAFLGKDNKWKNVTENVKRKILPEPDPLIELPRDWDTPLFSVIIPLYNNENYIVKSVESVLNQTFQSFEIIIVDDKSTDESYNTVKNKYSGHKKIKIFQNQENIGVYKTQNFALTKTEGQYIALLGSDDIFLPTRLEEDYKWLQTSKFVISRYQRISEKTNKVIKTRFSESMISFDKCVLKELGCWLNCQFSGDLEFLNRIRLVYGKNAINYNNSILYKAIKKKDKTNLTSVYNLQTSKYRDFKSYWQILHKHYDKKLDKEDKQKLTNLLPSINISNEDHLINCKRLHVTIKN